MALRLSPVRLLIADDVGVGKTIEAGLVVRELLESKEARRVAVLVPPHLLEQWTLELSEKLGLEATPISPATLGRLERHLPKSLPSSSSKGPRREGRRPSWPSSSPGPKGRGTRCAPFP